MLRSFAAETSAVELMHFPSAVTAYVTELYSDLAGYKLCHLSEHTRQSTCHTAVSCTVNRL